MSIVRFDEASKYVRPRRPGRLTRDQAIRRRNALWLRGAEVGFIDPDTGRTRPYSTAELAGLFGVTVRTVQQGITAAREIAEAIGHA